MDLFTKSEATLTEMYCSMALVKIRYLDFTMSTSAMMNTPHIYKCVTWHRIMCGGSAFFQIAHPVSIFIFIPVPSGYYNKVYVLVIY